MDNQRTIVITLDPDKLQQYKISPQEAISAVSKASLVMPSGNMWTGKVNRFARTNAALGGNLSELLSTPIRPVSGTTVYLRDIGTIENGTDIITAYAHVNGKRTVYIPVTKRADASTLAVINAVKAAIPDFKKAVPDDVNISLQFDQSRFNANIHSTVFPNAPAGLYFPGDAGFPSKAGMNTQWGNFGPRVGVSWDPNGDGKTSVRASYGRSYEFVNGQFHLNTSVAPPWGSEVRINSPSGGLDNPFVNSQGQTNIFPVTFDQNAAFSLNGPFLSLSNDMASTHVDQWNVTVERQITPTWFASVGYVGSRTSNIWESTPLNNALFVTLNGVAPSTANINARFQQPARTQAGMRLSFERNIAPALARHPGTHFDLVWPPYSMFVWRDFAQRAQLDVTLDFKRYVADAVRSMKNVSIVDLQTHAEITTDLELYMDIYHFAPQVDRWVIERTCAGLDRVDSTTAAAAERHLRDALAAWHPPVGQTAQ